MSATGKENRIEWLDVVRTLAIICVVLCHAVESSVPLASHGIFAPGTIHAYGDAKQLMIFALFTCARFGVPLFLFLTGYLCLPRPFETDKDIVQFWKRKTIPLVFCFVCWTILSEIIVVALGFRPFDFPILLERLSFLILPDITYIWQMWYMPVIIGIYVCLPFVARAVQGISIRVLSVAFVLGLVVFFVAPSYDVVRTLAPALPSISVSLDVTFVGGVYGILVIFGYLVRKYQEEPQASLSKTSPGISLLLLVIFIVSFALTVLIQFISFRNGYPYYAWYNFLLLFVASAALFLLIGRLGRNRHFPGIFREVALSSFGMFLVHVPINLCVSSLIYGMERTGFVQLAVTAIIGITASFILVEILSTIPVLARVLFIRPPVVLFKTKHNSERGGKK